MAKTRWKKNQPKQQTDNKATFMNASPFFTVTSLQEKWYGLLRRACSIGECAVSTAPRARSWQSHLTDATGLSV